MQTKYLLIGVVLSALVLSIIAVVVMVRPDVRIADQDTSLETEDVSQDEVTDPSTLPAEKLKADTFTGVLEVVDVGCFADGECFIEVDGKHVTALMGWSRETVGSVRGVEGFGDLEQYIGSRVEVYAQALPDGTYTLYGSEGFYIELLEGAGASSGADVPESADEQKPQIVGTGCMVAGCSSQLCVDAGSADIMTTCEYRAEYACYQVATCERQASGACGWTDTGELSSCITDARANETEVVY